MLTISIHDGKVELPLTFKVLHDIKEFVVHIWSFLELNLDLVEVGERVLDIERTIGRRGRLRRRLSQSGCRGRWWRRGCIHSPRCERRTSNRRQ